MTSCARCEITRITQQADILKEVEWDNTKTRVIVPTQSSSTIINSLHQLFRATHEVLVREDEQYVFSQLLTAVNSKLFGVIKTDLIIRTESGYALLCQEMDYLSENFKSIFEEKLQINVQCIGKSIKDIENIKTAHLF